MERIPLPTIQAQLGHANIQTTNTYVARIAPAELAAAIRGRRPWDER
jgi:integrase